MGHFFVVMFKAFQSHEKKSEKFKNHEKFVFPWKQNNSMFLQSKLKKFQVQHVQLSSKCLHMSLSKKYIFSYFQKILNWASNFFSSNFLLLFTSSLAKTVFIEKNVEFGFVVVDKGRRRCSEKSDNETVRRGKQSLLFQCKVNIVNIENCLFKALIINKFYFY